MQVRASVDQTSKSAYLSLPSPEYLRGVQGVDDSANAAHLRQHQQ